MKRRVLVLEDLAASRKAVVNMVEECGDDLIVYDFADPANAYQCAMENKIDLFLVDIVLNPLQSNDFSGIMFAENIRKIPQYAAAEIVFITTLAGLEAQMLRTVHCFDYIEKPLSKDRVQKAVKQALCKLEHKPKPDELLFLRRDKVTYPVYTRKIVYIESRRKTLRLYTKEDDIEIPNLSLRKAVGKIQSQEFAFPSKGVAVNIAHIEYIDMTNRFVKMRGTDARISIGERLRARFLEELYKYGDVDRA